MEYEMEFERRTNGDLVQEQLFKDMPKKEFDFPLEDKSVRPLVRFMCDYPSTYPDDKKFGLQFTLQRSEEDESKIVIVRDDEFGHDMGKHCIDHEPQAFPYSVQKQGVVGLSGSLSSRDIITVVLTPEEFMKLLQDLTGSAEITLDVSRQIQRAREMRDDFESLKSGMDYNTDKKVNIVKVGFDNNIFEKIESDVDDNKPINPDDHKMSI